MLQLNPDDLKVSCLNIGAEQLPDEFIDMLEALEPYTYMDTNDLLEHMYELDTIRTVLTERLTEEKMFSNTIEELEKIMADNDCAYFRIVKM